MSFQTALSLHVPQRKWQLSTAARDRFSLVCLLVVLAAAFAKELAAAQVLNRTPGWPGTTLSGVPCYGEGNDTRFDYLSERNKVGIVEGFHFYQDIEQLAVHQNRLDGDLDYTLRSIPNHHRALWARVRFHLRLIEDEDNRRALFAREHRREGTPPPECYFQRAKVFNPGDGMVSAVFGIYLHEMNMYEAALTEYKRAEELIPSYSELAYNMGLLYLDMGNLVKAREYADKARDLGHPLRGLRRKLEEAETRGAGKADSATN